ncbi:Plasmid replication initiator protein [Alcanivorax sp. DSM 26293]|uniref:replication initiator protein A n=1 Tax=Alcanivorax sp. DSM 26293 TaxID=1798238 RepID=UPI00089F8636|nr:replication initiator protein A [Alcanivorax sp. DSM 26293]SEF93378.1 Plasmid replication initiator protein [Alcanivorax sp. DSM 26293]
MALLPDHNRQGDFFVADILDAAPKDDMASMEHPLFALRAGDKRIRTYERNGRRVTILPGATGLASIHDKDLWIYCISQIVEAKNRGRELSSTVHFTMHDFLKATSRPTSGVGYERAAGMLRRLSGTRIETNIETNGQRERQGFGLIDSWRVVERSPTNNRMKAVEVTLPDWLFRSIESMHVLTLNRDYFRIRKPLYRRMYELARKHCGKQPHWRVQLATLLEKSGSTTTLRKFRGEIIKLAENGALPDYLMAYDAKRDQVTFYADGPEGKRAELKDMLAGRPHVPVNAHHTQHKRKQAKRKRP